MGKARVNVWISRENFNQLQAHASQPGTSQTAIVDAALDAWFNPEQNEQLESILLARLGEIDHRHNQLEADVKVSIETLGQFILYWLTLTEPLRSGERQEAQLLGRKRYDRFLDQVSQRLQSDDSFSSLIQHRILGDELHTNA